MNIWKIVFIFVFLHTLFVVGEKKLFFIKLSIDMKFNIKAFIFCVLLMAFFSCGKQDGNVAIKGEIQNLETPYVLASYISADTLTLDTIFVNEKGRFNYRNTIDTLTVFTLYFNDYRSSVVVFADKDDKLSVKGDAIFSDLIKVNGNEINNELTAFKVENEELLKQRGQLLANLENETNGSDGLALNLHEGLAQLHSLNLDLLRVAEEYVKNNPTKVSSLILINDFFADNEDPKALDRVLEYLQGDVAKSRAANNLRAYSERIKRSVEGEYAPYFKLTDKDDKTILLSDFNGKYVLLSFLSSAGKQSRENVEALKKSYENLDKDSVQFVSVYIDTDIYPVTYLETDSIPWTIVPETKSWASDIVESYNIQIVPYNILIDPDGIIKERDIPAQQIVASIKNHTSETN